MKNYILSIALVLSISACKQNKAETTNTTTETTQTEPLDTLTIPPAIQVEPSVAPTEPSVTESEPRSEPSGIKTKSKSTSSKSKSQPKESAPSNSGDEVVKKALYTPAEREATRKNFIKEVDQIDMSPEIRAQYTTIVQKHWSRIRTANNERKLTKTQATDYVNRVIKEQNSEIKRILTVEQYNKHMLIMNRYHNSVLYRIEQQ